MWFYNLLLSTTFLTQLGQINFAPSFRDFKNARDLAKKFGEKIAHEWAWKKLNINETVAISKYSYKDSEKINKYLNQTKGQLITNDKQLNTQYNLEYLNKNIELIDSGLKKAIIPESLKVYKRTNESFFGINNLQLRDRQMTINFDAYKKIKQDFINKKVPCYSFLSTSLINEPQSAEFHHYDYPILMNFHVLKGTSGAYLCDAVAYFKDEYEILINRGYYLKYIDFSIIKEFEIEAVKVDVLVEEDETN